MGLVVRKPGFGVPDKVTIKPVSSASETSKKISISLERSPDMILSNTRKIKALIRLRICAGWSAPLLFANWFCRDEAHMASLAITILKKLLQRRSSDCADAQPAYRFWYCHATKSGFLSTKPIWLIVYRLI